MKEIKVVVTINDVKDSDDNLPGLIAEKVNPGDDVMLEQYMTSGDVQTYASFAAGVTACIFRELQRTKPNACPALFALRVAEYTVGGIEADQLAEIAREADIEDDLMISEDRVGSALAHGESANFDPPPTNEQHAKLKAAARRMDTGHTTRNN
jgi:hypothetical protein